MRGAISGLAALWFCCWLGVVDAARADALVLLHGYQSGAATWFGNGVTRGLEADGWRYAGELLNTAEGPMLYPAPTAPDGGRVYYVVNLPYEAPLAIQSRTLAPLLEALTRRHADEHIILVGHSNGGVVARLTMVLHPSLGIHGLITVASPHLGTDRADWALMAGATPLAMMTPFIGGGTLNRSRRLYQDLAEEAPGSLIHWLNRQPHPPARYVSVVHDTNSLFSFGDLVVPARSQDLRNVPALGAKARTTTVEAGHGLEEKDGRLLGQLADEMLADERPNDEDGAPPPRTGGERSTARSSASTGR